ncbi:Uncharacterised protein [Mycobacterium tuberculosis]|uniref:Uncharacterized protein n=2 Tax=Mycobacterium tuberculosis TaxID=1773 RepID=A0A655FR82_MYCTX|nr:Uncharacterised protein [Mycobacterium tuberculosis]CKR54578.1 Uncharacterised protein [Mycobacterium tuberculosis]CKT51727.1 Uncharacterised protein [Mycobacterium tuberculosis]CKU51888.1 Uncharacterised protein [Mycobacterium tuberculosis]CKU65731.1 Uncharacterised protein [Mycobacterium tuberculosis]
MLFGMNTTKLVIVMPLRLKVGRLMTPEFACVAMPGVLKPPILIWGVLINGVCIVGSVNPPTVVPAGIVIGGTVTDGILSVGRLNAPSAVPAGIVIGGTVTDGILN